ncbi:MAG TPA: hypothetical protein ENJ15_03790 [Caldithrix abyssi]|uniref:Polyketide cyclase n=1 Tax=Caldithrix abyssi TaxID=187145 RepID=A0A7V5VEU7_CALAY|nr:hypothetical protein [Caldithrix abyssi]
MKSVSGIIVVIVVVVGGLALVPLFISPEVSVSRSVEIDRPVELVFNVVKNYDYNDMWNPFLQKEPGAQTDVDGEPGEIGSRWMWSGDTIGQGSLTLVALEKNRRIVAKTEFIKPMVFEADDIWTFEPLGENKTRVTWTFKAVIDSYFLRLGNLSMDSNLGPQFKKGLQSLKKFIEKTPNAEEALKQVEHVGGEMP